MNPGSQSFTAACVQVNAGNDLKTNIDSAVRGIAQAASDGADFVALPENVGMMPGSRAEAKQHAADIADHPAVQAFQSAARAAGVWVLAGTVGVPTADGRVANRSLLIAPDGTVNAEYDKIHMFDADPGDAKPYRESETYRPGTDAVLATLPWLKMGMTVCYDVRFPGLYRQLGQAGAGMLAVPSAFTETTGQAHWHVLLRARAIENGCFVIAPAQCGSHPGDRRTYGHSMIIDPWGTVLAEAGDGPEIISATIDTALITKARTQIPALDHDRDFVVRD
ncbi:MAG: carbon-nitrogen hydrolase family protein [Alphaproteobacteria bacterium]|nr:carbon-nitrogen hydrolase family protein [Alphaproteobacteria bacterium]MBT5859908.1 carbon-nitrogen hydrolase family protein [Alphaproteobacteria bacterium]